MQNERKHHHAGGPEPLMRNSELNHFTAQCLSSQKIKICRSFVLNSHQTIFQTLFLLQSDFTFWHSHLIHFMYVPAHKLHM